MWVVWVWIECWSAREREREACRGDWPCLHPFHLSIASPNHSPFCHHTALSSFLLHHHHRSLLVTRRHQLNLKFSFSQSVFLYMLCHRKRSNHHPTCLKEILNYLYVHYFLLLIWWKPGIGNGNPKLFNQKKFSPFHFHTHLSIFYKKTTSFLYSPFSLLFTSCQEHSCFYADLNKTHELKIWSLYFFLLFHYIITFPFHRHRHPHLYPHDFNARKLLPPRELLIHVFIVITLFLTVNPLLRIISSGLASLGLINSLLKTCSFFC